MHIIEIIESSAMDGTRFVYLNGKSIKSRSIKIESDVFSKMTKVTIEVYHVPLTVRGDDAKTYIWELCPCKVIANLPGTLFEEEFLNG
jgi:hypothetical protein